VYGLDASRLTKYARKRDRRLAAVTKAPASRCHCQNRKASGVRTTALRLIGSSKIVRSGAIDMAGADRGNMRCFEAMGCGALLLSDEGNYPEGMNGHPDNIHL
jgi:hypothetical protein